MLASDPLRLRRARDFGDVLNATFHFLRLHFAPLSKGLLFFAVPFALLASVGTVLVQRTMLLLGGASPETPDWAGLAGGYAMVLSGGLLTSLAAALVIFAYLRCYAERGAREAAEAEIDVRAVWRTARPALGRYAGAAALALVVILAAAVMNIVPCLGTLAYIGGLVYFAVQFSLTYPVLMQEDVGVIEAFGRSRALVEGAWWETCGILFVAYVVSSILGGIFSLPGVFAGLVVSAATVEGETVGALTQVALALGTLVGSVGTTLLAAIPLLAVGILYYSRVEARERAGLMERVEALEAGLTPQAGDVEGPNRAG